MSHLLSNYHDLIVSVEYHLIFSYRLADLDVMYNIAHVHGHTASKSRVTTFQFFFDTPVSRSTSLSQNEIGLAWFQLLLTPVTA
jgi:hypothetical protein